MCGEPEFLDAELDTLVNPTLIIEVLSPDHFDGGKKLALYRDIPSFSEYVTFLQDRFEIEHHVRRDGVWITPDAITDRDALIALETISCALKLSDVYEGVTLDRRSL